MSQTHRTERRISGADGETYEISTGANTEGPYNCNIAIVEHPEDWEMEVSPRKSYDARPLAANEAVVEEWGNSDKACTFQPVTTHTETRVTVAIDWYRVYNSQTKSTDDRWLKTTTFVLPMHFAVECATAVLKRPTNIETRKRIERVLTTYQRVYDCSLQSAYATWVYDIALIFSDADHGDFLTTLETEYTAVEGIIGNVLTATDLTDTGDRLGESGGWLLEGDCVRLGWTETVNESDDREAGESKQDDVRDWRFRRQVLDRYGTACAVCGLDVRSPAGNPEVEAAHVHAREEGGPDVPENGLPLCQHHHWAYDTGWLAIADDYTIVVRNSPDVQGYGRFASLHGNSLKTDARPDSQFTRKHRHNHNITTDRESNSEVPTA